MSLSVYEKCIHCMLWELQQFSGMAKEAYASTAMEKGITAQELRANILKDVHAVHSERKSSGKV